MERTALSWRKSSYSSNTGACVEVADTDSGVHVRDTQNRSLGHLSFPGSDWTVLLTSLRGDAGPRRK
ncbi:DUF397 domain-containing protein [Nocardiopsis sp. EMB25]|uniref:DUF397 domain-containing protein n=1 Tax=Nocardiopsis TaxID=2013 RepID=UPI0003606671|nr:MULTISPECIES: DUF397 domain-containing protein [Nocardiopsis]MCY9782459.1 DUF397 domain-containing protein [Nocardiopsis sp. EMB25]